MSDWSGHWNSGALAEGEAVPELLAAVGRTVGGAPVGEDQVAILARHLAAVLPLGPADRLLDIGCGNGVVTQLLAARCGFVLGVDFSAPLLEAARRTLGRENVAYRQADVRDLSATLLREHALNCATSSEVLQHLGPGDLRRLILVLSEGLGPGWRVLLSGIPEAERIRAFYDTPERWRAHQAALEDGTDRMGRWWSFEEIAAVAAELGIAAERVGQPAGLYTAHYRFDVLLRED